MTSWSVQPDSEKDTLQEWLRKVHRCQEITHLPTWSSRCLMLGGGPCLWTNQGGILSPAVLTHLRMVTSLRLLLNMIVVHISFCKEVLHAIVLPSATHLITLLIHVPMVLWQNIVEWLLHVEKLANSCSIEVLRTFWIEIVGSSDKEWWMPLYKGSWPILWW